ncbi:MAG: enoyl-CoA hydratase/isomerase family protein [Candidatus Rokubacteria bacterium]|nr:enoyl-CoA hydratase/isomerase family protein [Candidatus Rokubacteria bacterium]
MGQNEHTRWWQADGIGYIVIDNPPMNVLSPLNRQGMLAALTEFRDAKARAVVITGAGDRAFCGGADLKEEEKLTDANVQQFLERGQELNWTIRDYDAPIIGAINGWAMGGGLVLALWCDLRLGSTRAKMGAVGVKVGLMASNIQLTRFLNEARARDLLLTGRTVEAEEALRLGLLSKVVSPDALLDEATAWAKAIAARPPAEIAQAKRAINGARDGGWVEVPA